MIQSLAAATLMSCSTTITVLPDSTRPSSCVISFATSDGCKPVVGSSRTYSVSPRCVALQFGGQLDALSLAAGKFRSRLSQPDISQADLSEDAQRPAKRGVIGKEIERAVYRHREDIGNRLISDFDFQRLGIVARALAGRTGSIDAGQKEQFYAHKPFPLAGLAPALRNIEGKTARIVPPGAGLLRGRKEFADMIERPVYVARFDRGVRPIGF